MQTHEIRQRFTDHFELSGSAKSSGPVVDPAASKATFVVVTNPAQQRGLAAGAPVPVTRTTP